MKKPFIFGVMAILGAAGAYQVMNPEGPVDFYTRYHGVMAKGRTFDEDAAFHSAARRAEIGAQIEAMGEEDANRMKNAYLDLTHEQARCSEMVLAEESVTGDVTRLVYDVTDTCGTYQAGVKVQEIIELVEEDGWKILSNTTNVSE